MIEEIADGIYCIDTELYRPGLAAAYLVRGDRGLAFVDTGAARALPLLLDALARLNLTTDQVEAVIPTHVHLDHAGAAGGLMDVCPNARLIVHPKGATHLIDPARLTAGATAVYGAHEFEARFGALVPVPETRVELAGDGYRIDLGNRRLSVLDTPGHANHHACIFDERTRGWFTGDTFGIAYPEFRTPAGPWLYAPTTPVAFDPPAWHASIDRLLESKPQAVYLTHFGRLDEPARWADQLRSSIDALADLALREEDQPETGRVERLKSAVLETLLEQGNELGITMEPERIRDLLRVDVDLNAQGLDVWLKRRRNRREANAATQ